MAETLEQRIERLEKEVNAATYRLRSSTPHTFEHEVNKQELLGHQNRLSLAKDALKRQQNQ